MEQRQAGQHAIAGRHARPLRDPAGAGKLVRVRVRGDLRRAGGPAGVHERGQIGSAGRADPGQGPGRLAAGQLVQVQGRHAGLAVQGWRDAGGAIGPQREDRAHPGLAGDLGQLLPEPWVCIRPGRDQHLGTGALDEGGDPVRAERRADRRGDPGGLRGQGRGEQPGAVRPA